MSESDDAYSTFPCDLCGAADSVELPHSREFHRGEPIDICLKCGFVYVKRRRSAQRIADAWSSEIFGAGYTSAIPAVVARLTFVSEFLNQHVPLGGMRVAEIGAGEGTFLQLVRKHHSAEVFGIEPSAANCRRLSSAGIEHVHGTIEDYTAASRPPSMDVVAILWTLENCQDCRRMLDGAYHALKPGGVVVIATGSRILVPFKKPLHTYLGQNQADTHSFRFSANTLQGILAVSGFETTQINRYLDSDVLCVIARKTDRQTPLRWHGDPPMDVYTFFERWYVDTKMYYPDRA
jgi:2-polyprenyl-3-methyl-5-hydroxy-6-metoxy-1,4-benzoquinol methylase